MKPLTRRCTDGVLMEWHLLDIAAMLTEQGVDPAAGLSSAEAARRLSVSGRNEIQERGGKSPWLILWEQFTSTMALILTAAALLAAAVGSFRDSLTIMSIVCLFAILGFVQEYRAERAMLALKRLAVPTVRVRRDGIVFEIEATNLVTGDIVLLEAGNLVPADCRVLESSSLKVQESVLTGEAEAVDKSSASLSSQGLPLGDRHNMIYMGTTIVYGRGTALVSAIGMATELGRIAMLMQEVPQEWTPLQRRLDRLGKVLAVVAVAASLLIFGIGVLRGEDLRLMLMTAVSLAVAAIPEGLPAVVTITLAIGAQRMLRRQALIRRLPAVETLGSVTVICSDKTGTLTENRMTVTDTVTVAALRGMDGAQTDDLLLAASVLCNDAVLRDEGGKVLMVGDPTEGAILAAAANRGLYRDRLEATFPRLDEIPFDSAVKRMVTIHGIASGGDMEPLARCLGLACDDRLLVAKGASDALLPCCGFFWEDGRSHPLDAPFRAVVAGRVDDLASQGRRVLLVAVRRLTAGEDFALAAGLEGLVLLGLIAMMDPPREEARSAVALCRQAGIRPVMITGDHPLTASSMAASLGMTGNGRAVTGAELDRIGFAGLAEVIADVSVFARVSPEHKLLIVEALQKSGQVVAMTGDGVNDAPALKKADIGVAMGISGTDVAKESADMVLLDDNFATIVAAVGEGRTIYDNIRKFIEYSVAGNLGKILAVLILPFLGLPMPLTPLQLLWLNLLTDGLLGLGMGMERSEPDVMGRPPLSPSAQIFDRRMVRHTLLTGAIIAFSTIWLARHYWQNHPDGSWQTVLFSSLAMAQVGQAMALRSFGHSFLRMGLFTNPLLLAMIAAVIVMQGAVVYLPALQPIFKTVALAPDTLAWVLLPGAVVFVLLEMDKFVFGQSTRNGLRQQD